MGQDKAGIMFDGEPMWWRQWRKLLDLPFDRRLLSIRPGQPAVVPPATAHVITDAFGDCGPLGAVLTCLKKIELDGAGTRLLVLGIDLPLVPVAFLEDMLFASEPGCGAVAVRDGRFEPLCAVYPVEMIEIGQRLVRLGHTSMQGFIREGIERSLMVDVNSRDYPAEIFSNLNTPEDLARVTGTIRPGARLSAGTRAAAPLRSR